MHNSCLSFKLLDTHTVLSIQLYCARQLQVGLLKLNQAVFLGFYIHLNVVLFLACNKSKVMDVQDNEDTESSLPDALGFCVISWQAKAIYVQGRKKSEGGGGRNPALWPWWLNETPMFSGSMLEGNSRGCTPFIRAGLSVWSA